MEAHLHPQWQRIILPALLDVQEDLSDDLQIQLLIATHSPLVMTSMEPRFDADTDKLFHLDLVQKDMFKREVEFEEAAFVHYGTVDSWLMSDVFELSYARSVEAENAIEQAKALQRETKPDKEEVKRVSDLLIKYLPAGDEFWPRWLFFAEKHGVVL